MANLSQDVQNTLQLAACLGASFDAGTLELVAKEVSPPKDVAQIFDRHRMCLKVCQDEGLIENSADGNFRWVHDKIQESALLLCSSEDLSQLQYKIGHVLVNKLGSDELDNKLFVAVNLLNEGSKELREEDPERLKLSTLNHRAGKRAITSSAFLSAQEYLRKGIELLPSNHWQNHTTLSLELFTAAAEVERNVGDPEQVEKFANEVISQSNLPLLDKLNAYHSLVASIGARNRNDEGLKLIVGVLSHLGCKFPKVGLRICTLTGLLRAKATLRKWTPTQISALPKMSDPSKVWVMKLLDMLITYSYLTENPLLPLAILKSLRWTIKYGISEYSAVAFSTLGFMLTGFLGDFRGGRAYGESAVLLLDQMGANYLESRIMLMAYGMNLHWTMPAHIPMKALLRGYQKRMRSGDIESATWCVLLYEELAFLIGRSLEGIEADYRAYIKQMKHLNVSRVCSYCQMAHQTVLNLIGTEENLNTTVLAGSAMDESPMLQEAEESANNHFIGGHRRMQVHLAAYFGEYELGAKVAVEWGDRFSKMARGSPGEIMGRFTQALCCYGIAQTSNNSKYLKHAKKMRRRIKEWITKGNPNVVHCGPLLDAEMAILSGNSSLVKEYFETAIRLAARSGITHDQALAHEHLGAFWWTAMNDKSEALYNMNEAIRLYGIWGAQAKVRQIQESYAELWRVQ